MESIVRRMTIAAAFAVSWSGAFASDGAALFKARCAACHGANGAGNQALQAPRLAGQDEDYLRRQLQNFRTGQRGDVGAGATMRAIAQSLPTDADAAVVAKYIAGLRAAAVPSTSKPTSAIKNLGKSYFAICVACHGSQAEGNSALQAPRLNQLPAWYLTAQLQSYRNGTRGNHVEDRLGQQMRQVAVEALPDEEAVNAVAAYVAEQGAATSLSQPHRPR